MALDIDLADGEELLTEAKESRPFVVSSHAFYVLKQKAVAVSQPFYYERIPLSEVTEVVRKRLRPYFLWALALVLVAVGGACVVLQFRGATTEANWVPGAVLLAGLALPFAARRRAALLVRSAGGRDTWKPGLLQLLTERDEVRRQQDEILAACRQVGLQVVDEADALAAPHVEPTAAAEAQPAAPEPSRAIESAAEFGAALHAATPVVWVTPTLIAINALVFAAMVATHVRSFWSPAVDSLLRWGALYGPNVAAGEFWRLLTCTGVHIGILHVGFNMWCLWDGGRLGERLFGSAAFLVLYLFSGVGGSVASFGHNPQLVAAGASGAVFGVFGGILGFMLVRPKVIPKDVLRPLTRSTATFILYNLVYGFSASGIDNAAHVGGLVVGFLCGMLMSRRLPLAPVRVPLLRYTCMLLMPVPLVAGAAWACGRVPSDAPVWRRDSGRMIERYNRFITEVRPVLAEHVRLADEVNRLIERARASMFAVGERGAQDIQALAGRSRSNRERLLKVSADHEEIAAMRSALVEMVTEQAEWIEALGKALRTSSRQDAEACNKHSAASAGAFRAFCRRRDAFAKRHGVVFGDANPDDALSP